MPRFSKESRDKLVFVHPDLVMVCEHAIKRVDFKITEGLRSRERQRQLVREGKSWTMNSKHLLHPDGYCRAIDFIPYPFNGWEDLLSFAHVLMVFGEEASDLGIPLRFGGNWEQRDYPHIELDF